MFSEVIQKLKDEAQKTTKTNAELLADWHKDDFKRSYELSGQQSIDRGNVLGMGMGMSGVLGIMGVAVANQAAALGGSTLLAGVSTALAGLGTVAVGSAVLPVATVAVLGTAAAGVAILGINQLRGVDHEKADIAAGQHETKLEINALFDEDGHGGKIGLKNWLQGAKNLIAKSIQNNIFGNQFELTAEELEQKAAFKARMFNGSGRTEGEGLDPYDDIVNKAAEKLNDKGITGIIRDANKETGSYMGTVVTKNDKFSAIDIGRNNLVVVPNTITNTQLEVGKKVHLKFKDGVGHDVSKGHSQSREQGLGR